MSASKRVHAVWGFSFGGLGVELTVTDAGPSAQGTLLIALLALATFRHAVDDPSNPTVPWRVVLAVAKQRALVIADTAEPSAFAAYVNDHWYFGAQGLVIARRSLLGWRFDEASWTLSRRP